MLTMKNGLCTMQSKQLFQNHFFGVPQDGIASLRGEKKQGRKNTSSKNYFLTFLKKHLETSAALLTMLTPSRELKPTLHLFKNLARAAKF
ncbi:unnamed protein product [Ixodes pacificus]